MAKNQIRELIKVAIKANALKDIQRTGWVLKGVKKSESVSDHAWNVAFLALLLKTPNLDSEKLLKMIVIHDLGEILPGDIRWEEGYKVIGSQSKKRKRELQVVNEVFANFPKGKEYVSLLKEFYDQSSLEARFTKKVEKLEMLIQALVYEKQKRNKKSLQEFWDNANKYIKGSDLEPYLNELQKMRQESK